MNLRKKYAVIVAGGRGVRMGAAMPKQFLEIDAKPMLYYSVKAFLDAFEDMRIVLVLPDDMLHYGEAIRSYFAGDREIILCSGGETRFESVKKGIACVEGSAVIFVHDGARPLVNIELIERCYKTALDKGSAIPVIPESDSIRILEGQQHRPINRNLLRKVQTPQTFLSELILPAMEQPYSEAFTDEATVLEAMGTEVHLCEGDPKNLKVTTAVDLVIAEALLKQSSTY